MCEKRYTKRPREKQSALAEAAGLRWLREASASVVEVIEATEDHISTARVETTRPTEEAAIHIGQELAKIHLAGAPAHGAPPPGWDGSNYIGTQLQFCRPTDDWAEFYVHQRVLPFAIKAAGRGNLSGEGFRLVEEALASISRREWHQAPARLHGDLWSGNVLWGREGAVLIDPAAHGGHPETDLAMLALFGAPYLEEIYAGYQEVNPLKKGWRDRQKMHQLHPLAVHAVTHGPSYGEELARAAKVTIELLG